MLAGPLVLAAPSIAAEEATSQDAATTQEVVQKAVEKATEKVAEKAMEKAAEEKAAKEELTSKRPAEFSGPTKVHFFVFIVDIDGIDDAAQNFTANVYLRLRWQDYRLASPGKPARQMPLADVWNPRILLANQQGLVSKSLPEVVQVDSSGTVIYYQRYTGRLSQPLRLSDFPMDTHSFKIQFVAAGYTAEDLEFTPDDIRRGDRTFTGGNIAEELSVPDWKVLNHATSTSEYSPIAGLTTAAFDVRFQAKRYVAYYIWQMVLPLAVIVIMSWGTFWIEAEQIGTRVGVATSAILTLIAYRFVLASLLPRLPYMTRMDYFTVGSTLLVLLALIVVLSSSFVRHRGLKGGGETIDHWARRGFPLGFVLLLGWFLLGAWPAK